MIKKYDLSRQLEGEKGRVEHPGNTQSQHLGVEG